MTIVVTDAPRVPEKDVEWQLTPLETAEDCDREMRAISHAPVWLAHVAAHRGIAERMRRFAEEGR